MGYPGGISFQSFYFPGRYNGAGKWETYGMPEIPPNLDQCAFFLFAETDTGLKGPLATGFFVVRFAQFSNFFVGHTYAVTNAHAAPAGASVIRLTTDDGRSEYIHLQPDEWEFIAGGPDLAVADVTDEFEDPRLKSFSNGIGEQLLLTKRFIEDARVNIGEDGFMLGLFANAPGEDRNAPVGRFGNIAAMANPSHKIEQPNGEFQPSFIFDIRSRTGFSGSPVFIYRTGSFDMHREMHVTTTKPTPKANPNPFVKLLGVHCGQYPETIKFKVVHARSGQSSSRESRARLEVPSSMTIVVPAWEITRMLNLRKFAERREARERRAEELFGSTPKASPEAIEVEQEGANPNHKGDFMRLLNAAVTTKPSEDQT